MKNQYKTRSDLDFDILRNLSFRYGRSSYGVGVVGRFSARCFEEFGIDGCFGATFSSRSSEDFDVDGFSGASFPKLVESSPLRSFEELNFVAEFGRWSVFDCFLFVGFFLGRTIAGRCG